MRTLTADRKAAAGAQATTLTQIHETLDVHGDVTAKIAFHHVIAVDGFADLKHLGVRQLVDATFCRNVDLLHDLGGLLGPDAVDVLKRDHDALVGRNVDACYTGHRPSPCSRSSASGLSRVRWRP